MNNILRRAIAKGLAYGTFALLAASPVANLAAQTTTAPSYAWKNVRIVAGGYVDGIIAHPAKPGLFYARTDVGGAYRYVSTTGKWVPLNDWVSPSDSQWMGVESIAIDPNNPKMLFMVTGLYTQSWGANGAVLVSFDEGKTFASHPLGFRAGGNEDGRNAGERLQVDPNLGTILFYGTSNDSSQASTNGLWKSSDRGTTWSKVNGFGALSSDGSGAGVAFVAFYKPSGIRGSATKTIFAGVSTATATSTLYKSSDGGVTWTPVSGGPTGLMAQRGLIAPDGTLYITYGNAAGPNGMTKGQVWKYNIGLNTWQNITPPDKYNYPSGFSGLSIDPAKPGTVVVMTMDHWWPSDTMYRTTNGGTSWVDVGATATRDASESPWITQGQSQAAFGNWGEVVIDPFNPAHAMYGFGGGIWETGNLTAIDSGQATNWSVGANDIEETAVITLISPTAGAHLLSGLGDVCGFVHTNLAKAPAKQNNNPICSNGTGLDFAKNLPSKIVRVGTGSNNVFGAVSSDGGTTWTPFANQAGSTNGGGSAAISADGGTIVWAPSDVTPAYSTDNGTTWTTLSALPKGVQVVSDGANGNLFYAWNSSTGTFYSSSDKGVTWYASATNLPVVASWQKSQVTTVTGVQGDIWLATPAGLYRSTNSGWSWSAFAASAVTSANSVGFGKAATGAFYPTIYVSGTVNGTTALFRSTDVGKTWVQINDAQHQWGGVSLVVGDPRTFGTVYLGTNGARGVIYGTSND
ncbi:sialidase family protein [Dyella acidisoli]|uniref:Carbohydrate-binding protein n=1 Tax=Dyella acidisoli TaxID=1867834 RepID=A0ABQ5XL89_9GAMM|nr:sialidase family protein [Dyella acidisoli]GLQ91174.1 carbohydrate-binding protein [Dyella acidisoli]